MRAATRATIEDMSGDWTDAAAIFVPDFHVQRSAAEDTLETLRGTNRVVVIRGAPLVGKSHMLRELTERTAAAEDLLLLLVEAGG